MAAVGKLAVQQGTDSNQQLKIIKKSTSETNTGTLRMHRMALIYPLLCCLSVQPGIAGQTPESSDETATTAPSSNVLPQIGMSMSEVRQLLIGHNVKEELIGGACGMLEIINVSDKSIRVIGVGGVVTSISEGASKLNQGNDSDPSTDQ